MNTIKLNTIGERPIKKGEASGGGGGYEYLDVRIFRDDIMVPRMMSYISYVIRANNKFDTPLGWSEAGGVEGQVQAVMIDPQLKLSAGAENEFITVAEILAMNNKMFEFDSLPRISREEFFGEMSNISLFPVYYPNVGVLHSNYEYEEGMTWGEWCNSKYNTLGYTVYGGTYSNILGLDPEYGKTGLVWYFDSNGNGHPVESDDPIKNMYYYLHIAE